MKLRYLIIVCLLTGCIGQTQAQADAVWIAATAHGLKEKAAQRTELEGQLKEIKALREQRKPLNAELERGLAAIEAAAQSKDPAVKAKAEKAQQEILKQLAENSDKDYALWQAEYKQRAKESADYQQSAAIEKAVSKEVSSQLGDLSWFMLGMFIVLSLGIIAALFVIKKSNQTTK